MIELQKVAHFKKQHSVFPLAATTVLFENFGFYVLTFALVLYVKDIFKFSDEQAFAVNAVFTALVYLTPALGGYLADNILGIRRTIAVGLFLEALGLILLCLPHQYSPTNYPIFYPALALIIIGVGFFRVGPTHLMGRSYAKDDPKVDGDFTLYYMCKNVGAFFSPLAVGLLHQSFNWSFAFLSGAISLFFGLLAYFLLRHRASTIDSEVGKSALSLKKGAMLISGIAISFVILNFLLVYTFLANILLFITTIAVFTYFTYEIIKADQKERLAIIACLILIFIGMVFFVMFFQLFSSMTLFIDRSVFKPTIFGHQLLTMDLLALGSFWVIVLSPILVSWYNYLSKRHKDLKITHKFSLGLSITALCFLVLSLSVYFHDEQWKVSWLWIVLALMLYSLGELFVSALGVAMVTKIAPRRMYGIMMGSWFLIAISFAAIVSGKVAALASIPSAITDPRITLNIYGAVYFRMGIIGVFLALIVFILSKYINKIIPSTFPCSNNQ